MPRPAKYRPALRTAQRMSALATGTNRIARLRLESLEDRSMMAVAAFSMNLAQDLGGSPGALIGNSAIAATFVAEQQSIAIVDAPIASIEQVAVMPIDEPVSTEPEFTLVDFPTMFDPAQPEPIFKRVDVPPQVDPIEDRAGLQVNLSSDIVGVPGASIFAATPASAPSGDGRIDLGDSGQPNAGNRQARAATKPGVILAPTPPIAPAPSVLAAVLAPAVVAAAQTSRAVAVDLAIAAAPNNLTGRYKSTDVTSGSLDGNHAGRLRPIQEHEQIAQANSGQLRLNQVCEASVLIGSKPGHHTCAGLGATGVVLGTKPMQHPTALPLRTQVVLTAARTGVWHTLLAAVLAWLCLAGVEQAAAQSFTPPRGASAPHGNGSPGGTRQAPARSGNRAPQGSHAGQQAGYYEGDEAVEVVPVETGLQPEPMHADGQFFDDQPYDHDLNIHGGSGNSCRMWVRAEYLVWWTDGFATPPLVTTSPVGTPRTDAGVLGLPTTTTLFGGDLEDTFHPGGQVRMGYWFDACETAGIEGSYFGLGSVGTDFNATNQEFPILARPFLNLDPTAVGNDAEIVTFPGLFTGGISVTAETQLQGAEIQFRRALCQDCFTRVDWVAGWRYNQLDESLQINDGRTVIGTDSGLAVGTTLAESDRFTTQNTFNGGQIGFITETRRCCVWLETRMTVALGNNHTQTSISGQTVATTPVQGGPPETVVTPAGLLALPTNIGNYSDNNFAVVPQLGATLGWDITCRLRATVGYTFLYWSQVARPGNQIDPELNVSQLAPGGLVGVARPLYTGTLSDFWAQGLNFGLDYRF